MIEKLRRTAQGRDESRIARPVNRWEIRVWIDTEGFVNASPPVIKIGQKERGPLDDYRAGARSDGVKCRFSPLRRKGIVVAYVASVTGALNVAKELSRVHDWIRTETRLGQIRRLKERIDRGPGKQASEYVRSDWEEARALFRGSYRGARERFF